MTRSDMTAQADASTSHSPGSKPQGSVRVCVRVRPQLKRELIYRQVVEAVSVSRDVACASPAAQAASTFACAFRFVQRAAPPLAQSRNH